MLRLHPFHSHILLSVLLSVSARLGVVVESGCVPWSAVSHPSSQLHRFVERRHRHQAVEEELRWEHPLLFFWSLWPLQHGAYVNNKLSKNRTQTSLSRPHICTRHVFMPELLDLRFIQLNVQWNSMICLHISHNAYQRHCATSIEMLPVELLVSHFPYFSGKGEQMFSQVTVCPAVTSICI